MPASPKYRTTEDACQCADWRYRGRIRACKHVAALRAALEHVKAQTAVNAMYDQQGERERET